MAAISQTNGASQSAYTAANDNNLHLDMLVMWCWSRLKVVMVLVALRLL